MRPSFSVITVTRNSGGTLERCLQSVFRQSLADFELLVVDGGSGDDTLRILQRQSDPRLRWRSEPDDGIYDAMNKGIRQARGRYVAILNSDDHFATADVLSDVQAAFSGREDVVVYGDIEYFNAAGKTTRRWRAGAREAQAWGRGWHPPHSATFIPKAIYDRAGVYDPAYRLAADYKYLLSLAMKHRVDFVYLPQVLTRMATGGASTTGLASIWRGNRECLRAWDELGLQRPWSLIPRKLAYKLASHLKAV